MRLFGNSSCKRTVIWSNSCLIKELNLGALTREMRESARPVAHQYVDRRGVKWCTGKKQALKDSQNLGSSSYFPVKQRVSGLLLNEV